MADPKDKPKRHTVADHELGADLAHVHDGDADHDHDDFVDGPIEENPLWIADNVTLTSVGIDIGSAGTQVIFSKVHLRRLARGADQPLLRGRPRDAVPLAGRAHALSERGAHRRRRSSAPSSTTPTRAPASMPEGHRHRRGDPDRRGAAARQRPGASPACWPSKAAISSPPPPAITWKRCWRPTAPAPRGSRPTRASASSTSTSAAAPPSSRWSRRAA